MVNAFGAFDEVGLPAFVSSENQQTVESAAVGRVLKTRWIAIRSSAVDAKITRCHEL